MSSSADLQHGPASFRGRWFDGQSPVGRDARVEITPAGLSIRSDAADALWPWIEVKQTRGAIRGEPVQFERRGAAETLVVQDPAILEAVRGIVPEISRHFRRPSRRATAWSIALGIVAVIVASFIVHAWAIPEAARQLAKTVPVAWEVQFGETVMQSALRGPVIEDDAIVGPVDLIVQRLRSANASSPYTYIVTVVDEPEVNAYAAPGGYIVLNRGLLAFARSPDELASVIAHEIQHVERRHVTRGIFQKFALSATLAIAFGGAESLAGQAARTLGELSYSRSDESEADREGLRLLEAAGGDGQAMATMLERMETSERTTPVASFLSTHPGGAERAKIIRSLGAAPRAGAAPLLSDVEWTSLKSAVSARASSFPVRGETPQTPSTPR
jgi:beta-barrel assembly-enhancing protease